MGPWGYPLTSDAVCSFFEHKHFQISSVTARAPSPTPIRTRTLGSILYNEIILDQ